MVQNIFVYLFHPPFHAPMVSAVPVEGAAYACCLGNRVTLLSGTILFNFYCETPQETAVELLASWTCPATLVCNIILAGFVSSFHQRQKLDIFMCPCWPKLQNLLQHHFFFLFSFTGPGMSASKPTFQSGVNCCRAKSPVHIYFISGSSLAAC